MEGWWCKQGLSYRGDYLHFLGQNGDYYVGCFPVNCCMRVCPKLLLLLPLCTYMKNGNRKASTRSIWPVIADADIRHLDMCFLRDSVSSSWAQIRFTSIRSIFYAHTLNKSTLIDRHSHVVYGTMSGN